MDENLLLKWAPKIKKLYMMADEESRVRVSIMVRDKVHPPNMDMEIFLSVSNDLCLNIETSLISLFAGP